MTDPRPRLFERLKVGLEEGIQHAKGELSLKQTLVEIPDDPPEYTSDHIRGIRAATHMNRTAFSRLLNVSIKTVEGWEQGVRKPGASASRLLQFIENPRMLDSLLSAESRSETAA